MKPPFPYDLVIEYSDHFITSGQGYSRVQNMDQQRHLVLINVINMHPI